ncbi:MAG: SIMPL domain-containing protein [Aureispira sp.]|nr:SIMPL domain-containing protein [Aureispira sp.]
MQKVLGLLFFLGLIFNATAQSSGNINYDEGNANSDYTTNPNKVQTPIPNAYVANNKTVTLSVKALSNQKADAYVAIFNITQMGKTIEEANKLLNDRYNGFAEEAQEVGVPKSNLYLDMVSFVPLYEVEVEKKVFGKTYNEIPKGFEMQQNIHIRFTNHSMLGELLSVAAKYEIYDLVKVDYFVENQEAVYVDLRKKSVANLVKQIELYVDELGVDLESGYRIIAEDKKVVFPTNRYSSYQAFSSMALSREASGSSKGKVNELRKPRTMYYDKVSYDQFDIVVNPIVVEPAVQFLYNIKVQVNLKGNESVKEYIWLTPDGDQVKVKLD